MKYMGSKKAMLTNGLGELLVEQTQRSRRFFDPFCGSAAVSWFVAENTDRKVIAGDLQKYSVELANSILQRDRAISDSESIIFKEWIANGKKEIQALEIDLKIKKTKKYVTENKRWSSKSSFNITNAYGGHYFSFNQAIAFDVLLNSLPQAEPFKSIALASLIEAASNCVSSPGHTAQPFGTTDKGLDAIIEAWKRDPLVYVKRTIESISLRHANSIGNSFVSEANELLNDLHEGDLVFLDPPYSGVHYSRFYHVLETISRQTKVEVSGKGRYPAPDERPRSDYSLKGKSQKAVETLLFQISNKKASAILTFPSEMCSNGLSGSIIKDISSRYFRVKKEIIKGKFSTLGGNNENRPARQASTELVLLLEPK